MNEPRWSAVDEYITRRFAPADPAFEAALTHSDAAGLPPIHVTPNQGKLLQLLALALQARNILEIGTLGGFSTIWLARALPPGGRLVTLERESAYAEVARRNIQRAGLSPSVEIRVGAAKESLPLIAAESRGPFDLIFIDADKQNYPDYLAWAMQLSRRGTLIIADNVVR